MSVKKLILVISLFAALLVSPIVLAVPVISYGSGSITSEDSGTQLTRAVHRYGVEVDAGIPMEFNSDGGGIFDGFDVSTGSSLGVVADYAANSSVFTNTLTVTNTSANAKSFAVSTYIDIDIFTPTALDGCLLFLGDSVSCDSAVFNAATNSLITTNMFDSTIFAVSVDTSVADANLAFKVGSFDDNDLAWYSTLDNFGEGGVGDIALGIGYEMLINAGETFTVTYEYLVCTDTSGDACGLTTAVPESSALLLMLLGIMLLLAKGVLAEKRL